jgi:hypothetical protein
MKNKNYKLDYQLNEMFRLMGLKKEIINEAVTPRLTDVGIFFEDLLKGKGLNFESLYKTIENSGVAEAEKVNMGLENIVKKNFNELTTEEYAFISALTRKIFPEKFTLLTNKLRTDLRQNTFKQIMDLITKGVPNMQGGINKWKFSDFQLFMNRQYPNAFSDDFLKVYYDHLTGVSSAIGKVPSIDLGQKSGGAILNFLNDYFWKPIAVDFFYNFFKVLLTESLETKAPTAIKKLINKLNQVRSQNEVTLEDLQKHITANYESIVNKLKMNNGNLDNEIKELNYYLIQWEKTDKNNQKQFYDTFIDGIKSIPEFEPLFKPESKSYYGTWTSNVENGVAKNTDANLYRKIMSSYDQAKGTLPEVKLRVSKIDAAKSLISYIPFTKNTGIKKNLGDLFQRFFNIYLSWSPRSFEEAWANRKSMGTAKWLSTGIAQKLVFSTLVVPVYLAFFDTVFDYLLVSINKNRKSNGKEPWHNFIDITDEDFANLTARDKQGLFAMVELFFNHYKDKAWILGTHLDNVNAWSLAAKPIKLVTWDSFNELLNGKIKLNKLKEANQNIKNDSTNNRNFLNDFLQNNPKNAKIADSVNLNINSLDVTQKEMDSLKEQITNLDDN